MNIYLGEDVFAELERGGHSLVLLELELKLETCLDHLLDVLLDLFRVEHAGGLDSLPLLQFFELVSDEEPQVFVGLEVFLRLQ